MARRVVFLAAVFMAACVALAPVRADTVKVGYGRVDTEAFTAARITPEDFFNAFFIDNWAALSVGDTQSWTGWYRVLQVRGRVGQSFDWSAISTFTQDLNELSFTGTVSTWVRKLVETPSGVLGARPGKQGWAHRFHYEWVEQITTFSFIHHPIRDPLPVNRIAAVPGPVAGAGLPVLVVGALMWWRRRKGIVG